MRIGVVIVRLVRCDVMLTVGLTDGEQTLTWVQETVY
jgi:hypothetical protein